MFLRVYNTTMKNKQMFTSVCERGKNSIKCKRLVKFYFFADGVDRAFDRLIGRLALSAEEGERAMEKILRLTECKDSLSRLWEYLRGVITSLGEDGAILYAYASGQRLTKKVKNRVLMKFRRRAKYVNNYAEALEILDKYCVFCQSDGR